MKKLVVLALFLLVGTAIFHTCKLLGLFVDVAPSVATSGEIARLHVTADDMMRLGCRMEGTPKVTTVEVALFGKMEGYSLESRGSCVTRLTSTAMRADQVDEGMWAGARAASSGFARRQGLTREGIYQGNLGQDSELEIYLRGGRQAGFRYTVHANGYFRTVTVLSDTVDPEGGFEDILREKR
ncbi:MAG: hypothetical protein K0R03_1084 [Moraxellaceae bacterium]|jgi:hypothetical protein|nr:hypothetical protein [Moraxellaceae bacterium]